MSECYRPQRTRLLFDRGISILTTYLPVNSEDGVSGIVSELSATNERESLTVRRLNTQGNDTHAIDVIRQCHVEGSPRVSVVVYPGSPRARVSIYPPQFQRPLPLNIPPVEDDAALDVAETILASFEDCIVDLKQHSGVTQPCFRELSRLL